jgi:nitrogen-specific signal transduction histidine kinase
MQAQPLSTLAARISSLPSTPALTRPATNLALPPSLLLPPSQMLPARSAPRFLPAPHAAPHAGRIPFPHDPAHPRIAQQAGLAHDAGNLLGALRLYCDLLGAPGVLQPEHSHYAEELSLIAARSSALIERMLAFGPTNLAPATQPGALAAAEPAGRPLSSSTVLRTLAPVLERIAAGAARVSVSTPATVPAIDLPAEALERIAVNLVRNAAEAIRSSRADGDLRRENPGLAEPGQVRVALDVSAGALRLTVEDNGPGMPAAIAAAFLRPAPLPAGASRGLGHRIVHELAESTGGKLSIRVRPGRGTTFCIRWDVHETPFAPSNEHHSLHRHAALQLATEEANLC